MRRMEGPTDMVDHIFGACFIPAQRLEITAVTSVSKQEQSSALLLLDVKKAIESGIWND